MNKEPRFQFRLNHISDVYGPDFIVRTYLEHSALRNILAALPEKMHKAAELGAGYGRMAVVLKEFSNEVHAYERESDFINIGRRLIPQVSFVSVNSLADIPVETNFFDLLLTFTCLQHHANEELQPVLDEVTRIIKRQGYLLLCEETDGFFDDEFKTGEFGTKSRSVAVYSELLPEFDLIKTAPRPPEPSYPRKDVGTFMLFRKRAAVLD